jgi:hypothetical protein
LCVETKHEVDVRLDPSWRHIATHPVGGDKDTSRSRDKPSRKGRTRGGAGR